MTSPSPGPAEAVTAGELAPQLLEVVDLAVEDEEKRAVLVAMGSEAASRDR